MKISIARLKEIIMEEVTRAAILEAEEEHEAEEDQEAAAEEEIELVDDE